MNSINVRSYPCKDEELPVICRYSVLNFKRDHPEFSAFSPKFNAEYIAAYEVKIAEAQELVAPEAERAESKKISARMGVTMSELQKDLKSLEVYIDMANGSINLSAADFGLSDLRKGIAKTDPEQVIDRLKDLNQKVVKYKVQLAEQGFSDALQEKLTSAYASLNADRQLQYQTIANRQALVQSNIGTLNALYNQLKLILKTGKALFPNDPLKVKEYTFSELKKRVRRGTKSNGKDNGDQPETPESE